MVPSRGRRSRLRPRRPGAPRGPSAAPQPPQYVNRTKPASWMVPSRGRRRGFGLRGRRRRVVYEQRREESSPPAYRSLDKQVPRSARDDRRKKAAGRLRRRALPRPACHSEPLHALAARNLKPCRVQRSRFFASLRMTRSVCRLAGVADGGGAFFEQVAVPDGALAGVVGELEILRELEGVGGAGVFAAAAE